MSTRTLDNTSTAGNGQNLLAPGIHRGIPAEVYHAHPAIGSTTLKTIHLYSPAHARVHCTPTKAMQRGTDAHFAILQPDEFDAEYVVAGPCAAVTKAGTPCTRNGVKRLSGVWHCEQHAKGVKSLDDTPANIVTPAERDNLIGMRRSLWTNTETRALLEAATEVELTCIWQDRETGLLCKCRPDWLCGKRAFADLKKAKNAKPSAFCRTAADLAYHVQLAHYAEGLHACGIEVEEAALVAVEESPPWACAPIWTSVDSETMARGREARRKALRTVATCMETDQWPAYEAGEFILPAWA